MNGQSEPDAKQIEDEIRALVREAGPSGMTGSPLGLLLRNKWPTFSPTKLGATTLREFIGTEMKDIREFGRAGGDLVYGIEGVSAPSLDDDAERPDDLWRVWISPLSTFALAVEPNDGSVRRIVLGQSVSGAFQIGPAPVEKHRAIAKAFLDARAEALTTESRASLEGILGDPDPRWWERWNKTLDNISVQLSRNWFMFREAALSTALQETLQTSGLSVEATAKAFRAIVASRRRPPGAARRMVEQRIFEHDPILYTRREELVNIVQRVISHLTEDELRRISLPLGLVLDSLREKPKD